MEDNSWGWESGSNNLITTIGKGIGTAINWVMPEGLSKWLGVGTAGGASSLMTHIADAGKWVQAHPKELSYYGLAAAGLLGGFYLLKKFLNRKDKNEQIDPQTLAYAQKLDNMSPQQVRQQMGNQQIRLG